MVAQVRPRCRVLALQAICGISVQQDPKRAARGLERDCEPVPRRVSGNRSHLRLCGHCVDPRIISRQGVRSDDSKIGPDHLSPGPATTTFEWKRSAHWSRPTQTATKSKIARPDVETEIRKVSTWHCSRGQDSALDSFGNADRARSTKIPFGVRQLRVGALLRANSSTRK